MEKWKAVEGYEGLYEVSNHGRVKSLYTRRYSNGKIFKQSIDTNGYMKVGLYKNKKRFTRCVHRLVAIAFIPNPENLPEVNHKNGVKPNNFDYNLKWCTKSENQQHAYDNGLNHGCMGENNGRSKLMESDVLEIRKLFSDKKMNYRQVAENFGVTKSAVWAIVHNKTWKHI